MVFSAAAGSIRRRSSSSVTGNAARTSPIRSASANRRPAATGGGAASELEDVELLLVELRVTAQQHLATETALELVEDGALLPFERRHHLGMRANQEPAAARRAPPMIEHLATKLEAHRRDRLHATAAVTVRAGLGELR